jgi:membrane-bound lytic murein transglycosylase A
MLRISAFLPVLGFSLLLLALGGCSNAPKSAKPTYHRQLNPGEHALRKVDPSMVRTHLVTAFDDRESGLTEALDQSSVWYAAPSSQTRFPFQTQNGSISHDQARKSIVALRESLGSSVNGERFAQSVLARFDVYQTVGWDSKGTVLFTGYYAPIFAGSPSGC